MFSGGLIARSASVYIGSQLGTQLCTNAGRVRARLRIRGASDGLRGGAAGVGRL